MADIRQTEQREHLLTLKDRKALNVNGIIEVMSFDDRSVILKTVCGELSVEGNELHISELDTAKGAVSINGNIEAMTYYDTRSDERKGRFGRFGR